MTKEEMTDMATTAQQLTLFSGAPTSPVAPQPAEALPCPNLERYTDLTPTQAHNLIIRPRSATAALAAFRRAGWMNKDRTLTESGTDVLRRARAIPAGARPPAPVLDVPGSVRFRVRRADRWRAVHLKCLLYLARSPDTAWRYLTGIFGVSVVETLQDAGLVTGDQCRGAPQRITEDGLVALRAALDRAGVTYYLQAKAYD